ncbi:MAG: PepSY domain-containing protein [Rariglobus sp.]
MSPVIIRRLHRWIGLACALTVLVASGSGVLHVVMTWTQSPPPRPQPSGSIDAANVRITPAEAIDRLGGRERVVQSLSLRTIGGEPWYQIGFAGTPLPFYINALDGREDAEADQRFAIEIASRQLGGVEVRWAHRLEAFDSEYISIFRLLPVHRLEADDGKGTRLYVSTQTGSVARMTDDSRQFEANIFSRLHKYSFISHKGWRDGLLVGFTGLAFVASLSGVVLFFLTRRRTR